jgi:hypothetical protein
MIVFFLFDQLRFVEKRARATIAGFNQLRDRLFIQNIADHQKPVLIERLSLLGCEWNKIHCVNF